jgi:hypothetical protein
MPPLAWAQEQEQEAANAHVQATSVWQKKTSFRSPYEGTNSLSGAAEKSRSFTGTAAFGVRLGPSTEAYADPEVALGIPLSGLLGLAGSSNGELAKTSGANPTFYRARLFLRHTIGLGGGKTAVASAANQLASSYDSRRLVITAGNLSLLDLFDANAYAHDPRTQFLNWALMTHAAYDYAADSRGYTSGLAVEYIDDGWAVRAGRFAVPRRPNQLQLDERIMQHHGDQVEVARDYGDARWGGTVRVLAFRMRAVMASYRDALTEADLGGGAPSLDGVRNSEHRKTGVGVNIEHRLRDDIGLFARAMRADGETETYAFTEADRSLCAGASVLGKGWRRPQDSLGIAAARSFLSSPHRSFLARGGLTFFLGDGALNYRPEDVFETYYSMALAKGVRLSADFQRIAHPGYNADRGPVSLYALRLHWER